MDGVDNESRISRLESEIRYLKGLLDENGIAYDYETYVDSSKKEEPVQIEFPVLTAEHAIQFYSYFRGRKDVYVKRAAKKGYYTQCNNFSGMSGKGLYRAEGVSNLGTSQWQKGRLHRCNRFISTFSRWNMLVPGF